MLPIPHNATPPLSSGRPPPPQYQRKKTDKDSVCVCDREGRKVNELVYKFGSGATTTAVELRPDDLLLNIFLLYF